MKPKLRRDRSAVKEMERFLKNRHAELKKRVRSLMSERCANGVTRSPDSAAWATETLHDEIQAALIDRQSDQLAQIEAALERIRRRRYGVCQDCGVSVGLARLRAVPFAQRCRSCQSRAELPAPPEMESVLSVGKAAD